MPCGAGAGLMIIAKTLAKRSAVRFAHVDSRQKQHVVCAVEETMLRRHRLFVASRADHVNDRRIVPAVRIGETRQPNTDDIFELRLGSDDFFMLTRPCFRREPWMAGRVRADLDAWVPGELGEVGSVHRFRRRRRLRVVGPG